MDFIYHGPKTNLIIPLKLVKTIKYQFSGKPKNTQPIKRRIRKLSKQL